MATTNITAFTTVYNEEQWIWYAIMSVIDYVDKIFIIDTGSSDKSVEIIKSIKSEKIVFEERGTLSSTQMVNLLNELAERIKTDWMLRLDGDEIWPNDSISKLVKFLPTLSPRVAGVVVRARLPIGDLFHYQPESAGRYNLLGMKGHYNIRAYRKKKGYHWQGLFPLETYADPKGESINQQNILLAYLNCQYYHPRHLLRSSSGVRKIKLEIGEKDNTPLPEVFYLDRPSIVPSPWVSFSPLQWVAATILTPVLHVKRALT